MRLFPSGRGKIFNNIIPTLSEYKRAISFLKNLEKNYIYPKIKLQCALKFISKPMSNPCDMVTHSFGLLPDGTLVASPWAVGYNSRPLSSIWFLGNLVKEKLSVILQSSKVKLWQYRANENFGHCKFYAWFFSLNRTESDLFIAQDPLYK